MKTTILSQELFIIDSLSKKLEISKMDTNRVEILNELSFQNIYKDLHKAKDAANDAKELSQKLKYKKGEASAYTRLGIIAMREEDYELSEKHYLAALSTRIEIGIPKDIASIYNNLGVLSNRQHKYEKAKIYFDLGLTVIKDEPSSSLKAKLHNGLAVSLRYNRDFNRAIDNIEQSIAIRESLNDELGKAKSLFTLGGYYLDLNNFLKATESYQQSLEVFESNNYERGVASCLNNLGKIYFLSGDSRRALEIYNRVLTFRKFLSETELAIVNRNMGAIYRNIQDFDKSNESYLKSLKTNSKLGNTKEVAAIYNSLGQLNFDLFNYDTAVDYFQSCLNQLDSIPDLVLKTKAYYNLSESFSRLKKYNKAFYYSNQLIRLQDSLNEGNVKAITYDLNLTKEKSRISDLEKQQEIQILKNKEKGMIINGLIVFITLVICIGFLSFLNYRKRKSLQISAKNEELGKQKIIDLLNEQEIKASDARLEGQDVERKRIARDLHDGLGSMLSTIKLYFKAMDPGKAEIKKENAEQYSKAIKLLDDACEEVRRVAHSMESGLFSNFGLVEEIKSFTGKIISTNQLKVNLMVHGFKDRLDGILEIKVYRIIQELVNNVLKHAQASMLIIQLNCFKEVLNVLVEDDGVGFELESAKEKNGMGLKNIEIRIRKMHGSMIVDSNKQNGTTISIDIPLSKTSAD